MYYEDGDTEPKKASATRTTTAMPHGQGAAPQVEERSSQSSRLERRCSKRYGVLVTCHCDRPFSSRRRREDRRGCVTERLEARFFESAHYHFKRTPTVITKPAPIPQYKQKSALTILLSLKSVKVEIALGDGR
jgi:hypothetical protein